MPTLRSSSTFEVQPLSAEIDYGNVQGSPGKIRCNLCTKLQVAVFAGVWARGH